MQFRSLGAASRYFAGLQRALHACAVPDGPSGVAVRPVDATSSTYRGERIYSGTERWRELDLRAGARVTVVLSREARA
jgi:hypothetical protein